MASPPEIFEAAPPLGCVVEVLAELTADTMQRRWSQVNALLRLSMLTGLQMQVDPTLNMLCDYAGAICTFDGALAYLWDAVSERAQLKLRRNAPHVESGSSMHGNVLNFWSHQAHRPLLLSLGMSVDSDFVLQSFGADSCLVVPLFVKNRVAGSLQLFSARREHFSVEDAQLLWIMSLVSENLLTRETENESLLRFAFTDFLTGLRTRGYFEQQLELEVKRATRKRQSFALLMIDIDHFKVLNDTFGHHVGDQVLREVGAILLRDMREVDTVARYGGEEFVMVLPETMGPGAQHVAQRVRRAMEQARFLTGYDQPGQSITISVGYAVFPADAGHKREVIDRADSALYEAKRRGRNCVVAYSELHS